MSFLIEATARTPRVEIDKTAFSMTGECFPENISEFSAPVVKKLTEILSETESYKVIFELTYFNSTAAMFLFELMTMFETSAQKGMSVEVIWRYANDDDTIEEAGEDFRDVFVHCKFQLDPA